MKKLLGRLEVRDQKGIDFNSKTTMKLMNH